MRTIRTYLIVGLVLAGQLGCVAPHSAGASGAKGEERWRPNNRLVMEIREVTGRLRRLTDILEERATYFMIIANTLDSADRSLPAPDDGLVVILKGMCRASCGLDMLAAQGHVEPPIDFAANQLGDEAQLSLRERLATEIGKEATSMRRSLDALEAQVNAFRLQGEHTAETSGLVSGDGRELRRMWRCLYSVSANLMWVLSKAHAYCETGQAAITTDQWGPLNKP